MSVLSVCCAAGVAEGAVPKGNTPWERVISVCNFNAEGLSKDPFKELSRWVRGLGVVISSLGVCTPKLGCTSIGNFETSVGRIGDCLSRSDACAVACECSFHHEAQHDRVGLTDSIISACATSPPGKVQRGKRQGAM